MLYCAEEWRWSVRAKVAARALWEDESSLGNVKANLDEVLRMVWGCTELKTLSWVLRSGREVRIALMYSGEGGQKVLGRMRRNSERECLGGKCDCSNVVGGDGD